MDGCGTIMCLALAMLLAWLLMLPVGSILARQDDDTFTGRTQDLRSRSRT